MRRLIVPIVMIALLVGVEAAARRVDTLVPAALLWDTQFTQDKANQVADLGDQLEVVFVGSSVAQANIDPALFIETSSQFVTAYNVAIPSATPRIWREFIRDTVYLQTCPSVVVIGVDLRQFNDNKPGSDGQLDRYLNSRGRSEAIGASGVWQRAEDWLEARFALIRNRARLREPDKVVAWIWKIGERGDWRNTNLSPLGRYQSFDERVYEPSAERIETLRNGAFRDLALGGIETEALREMIADAETMGAIPVLVEMPALNERLSASLPNGAADLESFRGVLAGLSAEHDVPLIRLSELNDRSELFSDEYHMNRNGVDELTVLLAKRIDELQLDAGTGICPGTG